MAILYKKFWLCFGAIQVVLAENFKKEDNVQFRETDRVSDPVRGFFSEIGNLFLDVDETISKQTAPKVNFENLVKEQIYLGFRRPPQEYFLRIQENYKDANKRLGSSISQIMEGILTPSEIQKKDIKDKDWRATMDIAIESGLKQDTKDETDAKVLSQSQQDRLRKAFDGIFNAVGSSIALKTTNSDSKETSQFQPLKETWEEFRKRINSIPNESKIIPTEEEIKASVNRFVKSVPFSQDILTAISGRDGNAFASRSGDLLEENKNMPIEDFIQSKTTFEKYIKNLIENQGKWQPQFKSLTIQTEIPEEIAESPVIDFTPDTATELYPTSTEPINTVPSKLASDETSESKLSTIPALYEVDGEDVVELVLEPESTTKMTQESVSESESGYASKPKGIEILAFTPDGVPLKLRMDDGVENPLLFLHKALSSADVFLNIPVESFDDLEPAGKEVLQLGTGSIGTVTRALYLDLSNEYELKSLLKTLRMTQNIRKY